MSDFDIDPGPIAGQAARLRDLHGATTALPHIAPPETGETSAHTSVVLDRLNEVNDQLAAGLAALATDVDQCLATYAHADGEAGFVLELVMRALLA